MKATGAEIVEFFNTGWPGDDWYCEDEELVVFDESGQLALDPGARYNLGQLGYVQWQGDGEAPEALYNHSVEWWFLRWKRQRSFAILAVEVPKGDLDEAKRLCAEHGWRVR